MMMFSEAMEFQARFGDDNGAPVTARVCRALGVAIDRSSVTGRRVLDWPGHYIEDAVPLRLVAAFHWLYRAGSAPSLIDLFSGAPAHDVVAIRTAISDHDLAIETWLNSPPQTNEPGRSATFMAALLVLADRFGLPFELLEIGSSAGLNLLIDRYRYDLGGVEVGSPNPPFIIRPQWRGSAPPVANVSILSVRGVDIAPIDVTDPVAAERLLSFIWVDQLDRFARTHAAIEMARTHAPDLSRGDAADFVEARLAERQPPGTVRVLMHSIVWQYLPPATQGRIMAAMTTAGSLATKDNPLAWIAFEADRSLAVHTLRLRFWPGGGEGVQLARVHPHGQWIEWTDA